VSIAQGKEKENLEDHKFWKSRDAKSRCSFFPPSEDSLISMRKKKETNSRSKLIDENAPSSKKARAKLKLPTRLRFVAYKNKIMIMCGGYRLGRSLSRSFLSTLSLN